MITCASEVRQPVRPGEGAPGPEPFDRSAALDLLDLDLELLTEVASVFLGAYPEVLASLRQALQDRDPAALQQAAHKLKGSVAVFADRRCGDAALALEKIGRAGDLRRGEEAFAVLAAEVDRVATALSAWLAELAQNGAGRTCATPPPAHVGI